MKKKQTKRQRALSLAARLEERGMKRAEEYVAASDDYVAPSRLAEATYALRLAKLVRGMRS